MVQGSQHHIVADEGAVSDGDASLVLKVAAGVEKHIAANGDVLAVVGIEGREQTEALAHRLADEFREQPYHLLRLMVGKIQFRRQLLRPLAGDAHILVDGQAHLLGPLFKFFVAQETASSQRLKLVQCWVSAAGGVTPFSFPASIQRSIHAIFRPRFRMVWRPSRSCSTSSGAGPNTMFQ